MARLKRWIGRFGQRLRGIPRLLLVILAAAGSALVVASGVLLYRTYDYVQHDNEFCLSCHLMVDPYERFAQSAHRDLGCKACHQPTFVARSRMALAQIIEQPEEIREHAEVPNETCAACHIEGDPEQWQLIKNSLGHRVHLESNDPSLAGLMCVECHSTGIHEFAATDQTCGQSGCHEDTRVRLGGMADLTIHCVACHEFSRPVSPGDTALKPLQPREQQCLSCHQMRLLLEDMPPDEPHDRACGACHNPHDQETPREAVRTCATSGCHAQPDTLTPFHRGLGAGVLHDCLTCHTAHEFRVEGDDCLACHQDVFEQPPLPVGAATPHPVALAAGAALPPERWLAFATHAARQQDGLVFSHREHRDVECTACHISVREHGALRVASVRGCRECHHTAPVADECSACHAPGEFSEAYRVRQTFDLSVAAAQARTLSFRHGWHEGITCAECHRQPLTLAADRPCNACHEEHHEPDMQCRACHVEPAEAAHDLESHLGCAGSGCHEPVPFAGVPRTRNLCLSCHQDLVDHFPGENCAECHALPRPRAAAAVVPAGEAAR